MAPFSGFPVGAAVLTESGAVFSGCNVENASLGLTICAERVAACTAIAAGHRRLAAAAIASTGGLPPCGACRQFLAPLGLAMDILLIDAEAPSHPQQTTLDMLLPQPFVWHQTNR